MAKNGAENGAAPKAKIAKKVGRRTKCTEDYVSRFLERIEAGQSVPAAAAVILNSILSWDGEPISVDSTLAGTS